MMSPNVNRYHISLILIIFLGFLVRLFYFSFYYNEPADVLSYMHTAKFLSGQENSYGNPREIGYPLVLALFGVFFGINYDSARY